MLVLSKVAHDFEDGVEKIRESIKSGTAIQKLKEFIENQGGNKDVVDDYSLFKNQSINIQLNQLNQVI